MNKFYIFLMGLIIAMSSILLFNFLGADSQAALPRDCDTNSIINCGSLTASELATKYKANKTGDLPAIYSSYGLSANDMTHAGTLAKMGEVHKDGRVVVGGRTVATDAQSIGRHNMAGSHAKVIGGKTYYESPPSTSFVSESIVAFVFFDANGDFKAAVLTSCVNAVSAKKPPVYRCDSLTKDKITRTEYSLNATATANSGASITSYTYDFGDGQKTTVPDKTVKHPYANPGTYTAKLSVNIKVNGIPKTITSTHCQVRVVVETLPSTPAYSCDSLTTDRISRLEHSFTGKATATGGATIADYVFNFGDGNTKTVSSPTDVTHTYAKDGKYMATMTARVKVNGLEKMITSAACKVQVLVSPNECKPGVPVNDERCTPCDIPGKEQFPKNSPECVEIVVPPELPHTGPMDLIGGVFGLGSMAGAAFYWHASRRGLLAELLRR